MTYTPKTRIIFELIHDIIGTNLLTMFHEDLTLYNKDAPPPCGHFHEDRTINVTFRVLTNQMLTTHDGQSDHKSSEYSTELKSKDIFETNVLTKKKLPAPWH
ncbi:hypothetical protein DPMN_006623 [Dreissena polymorpha]|uniref:Uncharacterized protein n=1 Tax=Dreissena polymorpha TaxID=45954 RepID=A0A9D4MVP5_DREPO|nr:hypothetical protein DPMN_006623 [Dreissena polymorpha]